MTTPHITKRRGGPQVVFFGGDDAREEWTWECRFPHPHEVRTFNDAPTWDEAVQELAAHHRQWHGARGRHGCPRCGAPVCNRAADPERTDLCPPCTLLVFGGQPDEDAKALRAELDAARREVRKYREAASKYQDEHAKEHAEVDRLRAVQAEDYAGIEKMANEYAALQERLARVNGPAVVEAILGKLPEVAVANVVALAHGDAREEPARTSPEGIEKWAKGLGDSLRDARVPGAHPLGQIIGVVRECGTEFFRKGADRG